MSDTTKVTTPAQKYEDLRPETKKFLADLDGERAKLLNDVITVMAAAVTLGNTARWFIIGFAAFLLGAVAIWENGKKLVAWLWGAP